MQYSLGKVRSFYLTPVARNEAISKEASQRTSLLSPEHFFCMFYINDATDG